jgi:hypothetical protein
VAYATNETSFVGASRPACEKNLVTVFDIISNPVAYMDTIVARVAGFNLHVPHGRNILLVVSTSMAGVEATLALAIRRFSAAQWLTE